MKTSKYYVVRLDYGIVNSDGCFHQTHHFSMHRKISAALKSFEKHQKKYNCVDIVDFDGKCVSFQR